MSLHLYINKSVSLNRWHDLTKGTNLHLSLFWQVVGETRRGDFIGQIIVGGFVLRSRFPLSGFGLGSEKIKNEKEMQLNLLAETDLQYTLRPPIFQNVFANTIFLLKAASPKWCMATKLLFNPYRHFKIFYCSKPLGGASLKTCKPETPTILTSSPVLAASWLSCSFFSILSK